MSTEGHSAQGFIDRFAETKTALPGAALPWVRSLRQAGINRFASLGLPSRRLEAWKYTDLKPLREAEFRAVGADDAAASIDRVPSVLSDHKKAARLVFVNGRLRAGLSVRDGLPKGVVLESLEDALKREANGLEIHLGRIGAVNGQPMVALNAALMDDGFVLRVKRGVEVEAPIEIVFVGGLTDAPVAYHPHALILLEDGSAATVVEHHAGHGQTAYFVNGVTEIRVGDGAQLRHYKLQAEGPAGLHLATTHAEVGHDATYETFVLSTGSRLARHEASVRLAGSGARCALNGAYLVQGEQHCDITTVIEHQEPRTVSREVFKGVLDDRARAVFQGQIVVQRGAQKSDGHQISKALLLSDGAEIDAKPELRIFADDVKCSHGATAGQLDREAMFYLRSRGIPERQARHLLIRSFLADALEEVSLEEIRTILTAEVTSWLKARQQEAA